MNSNIISGARLDRIYVQKGKRGRFFDSRINPTSISDHYYVSVMVTTSSNFIYLIGILTACFKTVHLCIYCLSFGELGERGKQRLSP